MEGSRESSEFISTRRLGVTEILRTLGLIQRSLGDEDMKPDEDAELEAIDWVDSGDLSEIEEDERIVAARDELNGHRHDNEERHFMNRCRLVEWLVLIEKVTASQPGQGNGNQVA